MTKHEKLDGKTRVSRHRAAMRAKGYRLKQYWVPDTRTPEFREMTRKACEAINASRHNSDELAWAQAMAAEMWDDLPPYDAPLPGDPDNK
jgi:phage terminase small subunit